MSDRQWQGIIVKLRWTDFPLPPLRDGHKGMASKNKSYFDRDDLGYRLPD
jgi:hypothetical protein